MGMFNEVFKKCPQCENLVEKQIPQVVLGFAEFHLDDPDSTKALSPEEKEQLKKILDGQAWNCKCGHTFSLEISVMKPMHIPVKI